MGERLLPAKKILGQIDEKDYAERFQSDGRSIVKVGVNFSTACRNIDRWIVA